MSEAINPVRRRGRVWAVGTVFALAALAAAGWCGWLWFGAPAPPDVPLSGVEPDVAKVILEAREEVRRNGRSAAAWGKLGEVLLAHEYDAAADPCFAQAERLDANDPRWPYFQGLVRMTQNAPDPTAAIPYLRRAVDRCERFDPGNSAPALLLAEMLLQTGEIDGAEALLRRVEEQEPDNPRLQFDLGMLAQARQDDGAAARHYLACAQSPYTRRSACAALAAIRERQGDGAGAADYSRRAAAYPSDRHWNDPYSAEYLSLQAVSVDRFAEPQRLEAEGRLKEALPLYLDLAGDGSDARAQIAAGTLLYKMGPKRYAEAEHYFRAAVGLKTEQTEANYFLGLILYSEGKQLEGEGEAGREAASVKFREALTYTDKALEFKPDHVLALLYRGLALKRLGQKAEALEAFRQAVRCRPDMADAHLKLGEALADDGRREEAVAELRRAVEVAPADDARPREALERVLGDDKPK